ncbi:50S ribosomal protein L29 [Archaeoglobus profundus]|uniref:Large ribosomal subunit protein uL29 n=1 Tax=Archaeoglobus profundus (strain DSM 5631 / JCM 9629 / NBRC 100127 / Av18) TaxID=572546 RepID=D2RE59_ARCPA|nr:50S ribosomal protein L29 [Archaeoglobus profundus]ADB58403.1 ribosomal protein L29 [Archaeoglobus profundus DSM 5631]
MKMDEIRKMSREEKLKKLKELELELLKLRTKKRSGAGLENPMAIRNIRKDIARIKLALREEGYRV